MTTGTVNIAPAGVFVQSGISTHIIAGDLHTDIATSQYTMIGDIIPGLANPVLRTVGRLRGRLVRYGGAQWIEERGAMAGIDDAGPGTMLEIVAAGAFESSTLNESGTVNVQSSFPTMNGTIINSSGLTDIQGNYAIRDAGSSIFNHVGGIVRKSAGGGTGVVQMRYNWQDGEVNVAADNQLVLAGTVAISAIEGPNKTGLGALTIAGPQQHETGAHLAVFEGTLNLMTDAGSPTNRPLSLTLYPTGTSAVTLNMYADQHLQSLTMLSPSQANLKRGGHVLVTSGGMTMYYGAALDISDGDYIAMEDPSGMYSVTSSNLENGHIMSSLPARADMALGFFWNDWGDGSAVYSTWHGQGGLTHNAEIVRYTWVGDANLDGKVDAEDLSRWQQGRNGGKQQIWCWGDFNYDFKVDDADLALLMANMGRGGPVTWDGTGDPPPYVFAGSSLSITGTGPKAMAGTSVNNSGGATWDGSGNIVMSGGATFYNTSTGTLDIQTDAGIVASGTGGTLQNAGLIAKTAGTGTTSIGVAYVDSGGTMDVQVGGIALNGAFTISDWATMTKTGSGVLTINGTQSHGMGATLAVNGGTVVFNSDAGSAQAATLTVAAATGTVVNFNADQHLDALKNSGATITASNLTLNSLSMQTSGSLTVSGSLKVQDFLLSGGTVTTQSSYVAETGAGTFAQSGGTHTTQRLIVGNGTYELSGGTLDATWISNGGAFTQTGGTVNATGVAVGGASGGSQSIAAGASLTVGGDLLVGGSQSGGFGSFAQTGGTVGTATTTIGSNSSSGSYAQSGGTHSASTQVHIVNGNYDLSGGTLTTAVLINDGTFNYSGGEADVNLTNNGTMNVQGGGTRTIYGDVTNNGLIKTWSTELAVTGTFTDNGSYVSDPADNRFKTIKIGRQGLLKGGRGDRFFVEEDLLSESQRDVDWDTVEAELHFLGARAHAMTATGRDLGVSAAGYESNFAWGLLELDHGASLAMTGVDPAGNAIYLDRLVLDDGVGQVASLAADGVNIYYNSASAEDAYLGSLSYDLNGGGRLLPVMLPMRAEGTMAAVPEPGLVVMAIGAAGVLMRRRGRATG